MSVDMTVLGMQALETWKQYLQTYENPKPYRNVTQERRNLRYAAERLVEEAKEGGL